MPGATAREDAKLCRNLRRWAGDEAPLMFDGSAGWDLVTALWFGRVLEDCGFYWYEEPMREFDLGSYRRLSEDLRHPGACGGDVGRRAIGTPRPGSRWARST